MWGSCSEVWGGIKPLIHCVFLSVPHGKDPSSAPHPAASPSQSLAEVCSCHCPLMSRMVPWCFQVVCHPHSRSFTSYLRTGIPCGPSPHRSPPESVLAQDRVPQCRWSRDAEILWRSPSSLRGHRALSVPSPAAAPSRGSLYRAPLRGEGGEGGPSPLRSAPLGLGPLQPRPFIPGLNLGCARAAASRPPRPGRVSSAPAIGLRLSAPAL